MNIFLKSFCLSKLLFWLFIEKLFVAASQPEEEKEEAEETEQVTPRRGRRSAGIFFSPSLEFCLCSAFLGQCNESSLEIQLVFSHCSTRRGEGSRREGGSYAEERT